MNEDTHQIGERVLVIADGVGGQAGGEIASQTVASIIANVATSGPTDFRAYYLRAKNPRRCIRSPETTLLCRNWSMPA